MQVKRRTFSGEADLQEMISLAKAFPGDHLHVVDLPYRLSSWALDDGDNVGLWIDPAHRLIAWGVMQAPFWTIDFACQPDRGFDYSRLLAWADRRAMQSIHTQYGHPAWFVNVFASQTEHLQLLAQAGFASQAEVGEDAWSKVLMRRPATSPVVTSLLPSGLTIRPMAGSGEVEAYVALHQSVFESRNMTAAWRHRIINRPEYIPELDLVVVAPDGHLAAFCIGWLSQWGSGERIGQVEPLGVGKEFRGSGLGRAILAEILQRMHRLGASQVYVETDHHRNAALALYESAGFCVDREVLVYRKDYE
jgi:mycothiol synthase